MAEDQNVDVMRDNDSLVDFDITEANKKKTLKLKKHEFLVKLLKNICVLC